MNNKIPTQEDIDNMRAVESAKALLSLSAYPEYAELEKILEKEIKGIDNLSSVDNNEELQFAKGYIQALRLVLSLKNQADMALNDE
ncbi:MAG: hypothetical protein HRU12_08945 [Phaeodactylibacter sp.]|nr:hypothetical protein [Phaeodactylibacter sp.]